MIGMFVPYMKTSLYIRLAEWFGLAEMFFPPLTHVPHMSRLQEHAHSKQLPIVFGSVEQVFVEVDRDEHCGERSNVWLQALSGVYLLHGSHVASHYSEQFFSFLERRGTSHLDRQPSSSEESLSEEDYYIAGHSRQ